MSPVMTLLAMGLLLIMVMLALSTPWLRRPPHGDARDARTAANVAVYRQRLAEIDADAAAGLVDAETAAALREEQAARLVTDAHEAIAVTSRARWPWVMVVLAVPLGAGGLYFADDRWPLAQQIEQAREDPAAAQALALTAGRAQLMTHLQLQPDDAAAWGNLGELELASGEFVAAADAFAEARRIEPDYGPWWAAEGEALAMAADQDLSGAPRARFEQAVRLAPNDGKALFYAGLAAAQAQEFEIASSHWQRLAQQGDLPESVRRVVQSGLEQWGAVPPSEPLGITFEVMLDAAAGAPPAELGTLMVFVREAGQAGMPLAARRVAVTEWPVSVSLTRADWLRPDVPELQGRNLQLVARLSTGQTATAQPGDWSARAEATVEQLPLRVRLQLAP